MKKIINWILSLFKRKPVVVPPIEPVVVVPPAPIKPKQNYRSFKVKPSKKKRRRVNLCPVSGKVSYDERKAKEVAASKSSKYLKIRGYRCMFCPAWHITHKRDKLSFH